MTKLARPTGTQALLLRILEDPGLVAAVQALEPRSLARLIDHVGLEDAGELVALATAEQLERVFDEDLWRGDGPGREERFDAERFGLWLEILLEMGASRAAARIVEMDEDLVTLALSRELLVLDLDEMALRQWTRGARGLPPEDLVDKALESSLSLELDGYLVIGLEPGSWDAVTTLLTALDAEHHGFLTGLLERCAFLSAEHVEDNGGLYEVLTAAEQLESDVAFEREQRREREGFVPPQAAAAFLALARDAAVGDDAITRSHLRALDEAPTGPKRGEATPATGRASAAPLVRLLREADVLPTERPAALLEGPVRPRRSTSGAGLRAALLELREERPELVGRRVRELGYLANTLVSGCRFRGRALRPVEAAEAALATCELGLLERLRAEGDAPASPGGALARHGLVRLFGVGWRVLHRQVQLPAARALDEALASFLRRTEAPLDDWTRGALAELRASLHRHLGEGAPWRARERLDLLGVVVDAELLEALQALLDELPSFEGAFISTRADVERVEAFLRERVSALPGGR